MSNEVAERETHVPVAPYPAFEGKPVDAIQIVATASKTAFDEVDTFMSVDDRVLVMAQYVCVAVGHIIDDKTGNLVRVQTLRPLEMALTPWDASDPDDDGVLRRNVPGEKS